MIAYVNGTLEDIYEDRVVVDVGGIGYNVFISANTASQLPDTGGEVRLYTYTLVREDTFSLYGFLSRDELALFKRLITVSGIGPKGGLSILSVMSADDLRFAILSGDSKLIATAPGIGKKTAEKVILDLRDKVSYDEKLTFKSAPGKGRGAKESDADIPVKTEAVNALIALGYGSREAYAAVNDADIKDDMDVETVLKEALKNLI